GRPKNEWMVWPPTLTAASPVGATTTILASIRSLRHLRSVDLPVPARPVTNRCPLPSRRKSCAARNSSVGATLEGQVPLGGDAGGGAGEAATGPARMRGSPLAFTIRVKVAATAGAVTPPRADFRGHDKDLAHSAD